MPRNLRVPVAWLGSSSSTVRRSSIKRVADLGARGEAALLERSDWGLEQPVGRLSGPADVRVAHCSARSAACLANSGERVWAVIRALTKPSTLPSSERHGWPDPPGGPSPAPGWRRPASAPRERLSVKGLASGGAAAQALRRTTWARSSISSPAPATWGGGCARACTGLGPGQIYSTSVERLAAFGNAGVIPAAVSHRSRAMINRDGTTIVCSSEVSPSSRAKSRSAAMPADPGRVLGHHGDPGLAAVGKDQSRRTRPWRPDAATRAGAGHGSRRWSPGSAR